MTVTSYAEFVHGLCKPGSEIVAQLTPKQAHLWHMATGISGEAGELLDAIKKFSIYNKPLDEENVKEELGDIHFYMTGMMNLLGLTWADLEAHNIDKLTKRYGAQGGVRYDDKAAQARADKGEH